MATAALAGLLASAGIVGCTGGGSGEEPSARRMLDDANDAMRELRSVTVVADTVRTDGDGFSSRFTTDLRSRCTSKVTWKETGATLEQIRIGETDYVRPNRAYVEQWSGKAMNRPQNTWLKTPASEPGDGLSSCTRDFTSFGTVRKGEPTEIDGTEAVELVVTDKADKGGKYTFHVATEGKPYILKVVYKGADLSTTTTYSGFDGPLDVRAPAAAQVLDSTDVDR